MPFCCFAACIDISWLYILPFVFSRPFSTTSDPSPRTAKKQVSVNSAPFSDEVDAGHTDQVQYSSMPNLYKEPGASESTATGSKTKLKVIDSLLKIPSQ